MTVPRIKYDAQGKPEPLGVRAAAVKMACIVGQEAKGAEPMTEVETRIATAIGVFFGDEYDRISTANDELTRQLADLGNRLLEIARLADGVEHE